jgi:hypothetical protein
LATSNKNFKVKNGLDVSGAATASSFVKTGGSAAQFLMADGSISDGAGSLEVSPTPPESPSEGDIWYNSTTGQTFVYYDSFWVENVTGQVGPQGPTGATGPAGQDSTVPGPQGPPGADGFIGADGAEGAQGPEGPPGPEGPEGPAGTFGVLDEAPVDPNEGDVWFNTSDGRFYVYYDDFWVEALSNEAGPQGPEGPQGPQGPAGADSTVPGPAGADGADGATGPEGPQGPAGADSTVPGPQGDPGEQGDPGPGVAAGGTEGQVLLKVDGTDYNTTWADNSAESTFYLVRNNTGATITKGTLVAATGAEPSGRIDVAPFEVTGLENSELRVMGVATTNISNGVNGTVMSFGTLKGIDTRGDVSSAIAVGDETWAAGDILYAHPTVDGKLTKNKPQHDLVVAFITVRHATLGQMAIRITSGTHLEWLHDVAIEEPADGDVLTYNSTNNVWENSQIDYSTLQYGQNAIINGAFDIWQRGTSGTGSGGTAFTADRWSQFRGGGAAGITVSRQASGLTGFQYSARVQRDSGNTGTASFYFVQNLESVTSLPLAGLPVTLSFYARAGANYSATSSTLRATIETRNGTESAYWNVGDGVGTTIQATNNATLTTTWQRFTLTANVPSNATQIFPAFKFNPTGTAGANDWFEVTGVQLEAGTVATPFRRNAPNIQAEFAACQRYYQVIKTGAANSPTLFRIRAAQNDYYGMIPYLVKPRISTGFGYIINSPSNVIHKPAVRWDTIANISLSDMGTYLDVYCTPSVDDGSSMIGMHLYGIDIFCNAEL